jgi:cytochrome c biogenesis factor
MTTLHKYLHTFQHAYHAQFTEYSSKKAIFWCKDVEKKETYIFTSTQCEKTKENLQCNQIMLKSDLFHSFSEVLYYNIVPKQAVNKLYTNSIFS